MAKLLSDRCPTAGPAARFLGNYYLFFTPLGVEECLSWEREACFGNGMTEIAILSTKVPPLVICRSSRPTFPTCRCLTSPRRWSATSTRSRPSSQRRTLKGPGRKSFVYAVYALLASRREPFCVGKVFLSDLRRWIIQRVLRALVAKFTADEDLVRGIEELHKKRKEETENWVKHFSTLHALTLLYWEY